MGDLAAHLSRIQQLAESAQEILAKTPEIDTLGDLIAACEGIDQQYREVCSRHDRIDGEEAGTTYDEGLNVEFEIEGLWWHDVSCALRVLRDQKVNLAPPQEGQ